MRVPPIDSQIHLPSLLLTNVFLEIPFSPRHRTSKTGNRTTTNKKNYHLKENRKMTKTEFMHKAIISSMSSEWWHHEDTFHTMKMIERVADALHAQGYKFDKEKSHATQTV